MYTIELATWPGLLPALIDEVESEQIAYTVEHSRHAVMIDQRQVWPLRWPVRCAQSAFVVLDFAVPRPKALLGQQYFDEIIRTAQLIMQAHQFTTLQIDAAGSDSTVMQRIATELAQRLNLQVVPNEAEFVVRIRPSAHGWQVLLRLTPRPLGTRSWRVCNMPGAMNAVVAAAMVRWAGIYDDDRVLNVGVGSATLLIERAQMGAAAQLVGCDVSVDAQLCAQQNINAAQLQSRIDVYDWDATKLPIADKSIDLIMADLPFGQLIGTHNSNTQLYPAVIREAQRVLSSRGRMVLISHEIRLLYQTLVAMETLRIVDELQVEVGGMHPVMYLVQPT
ncbi:MAG: methyltransferase domain-containing protein [Chloroflexota bacterium]|jgi:tRNA (guanine6-N2)-methyltransferase